MNNGCDALRVARRMAIVVVLAASMCAPGSSTLHDEANGGAPTTVMEVETPCVVDTPAASTNNISGNNCRSLCIVPMLLPPPPLPAAAPPLLLPLLPPHLLVTESTLLILSQPALMFHALDKHSTQK